MGVANKQIGWSQESSLLHAILKQLEQLAGGVSLLFPTINTDPIVLNTVNRTAYNPGPGSGTGNTSFGEFALDSNVTGLADTAFGYNALTSNTSGPYNTAVGYNALRINVGAQQNTAVGAYAMETAATNYSTGIGYYALQRATGDQHVALGYQAGKGITGGNQNTCIGYNAMGGIAGQNTTGTLNTAIGYQAGGALTTGGQNILIENVVTGTSGVTSGNFNIIINPVGFSGITTGSNNVVIGGFNGTIPNLNEQVFIGTGNGVMRLSFDSVGQMTISNTQPQGVAATTEKLLVRDTAAGAVKSLDYIAVNATASALSLATLNATYTTARTGFRVICMSIAGGAIIYTKTSTGWSSTPVTNVV